MENEIATRLLGKINSFLKAGDFQITDLDEMKILHSHCQHMFSGSFNEVFENFKYTRVIDEKITWLERLLRIHEVDNSIPNKLKGQSSAESVSPEALSPKFELEQKDKDRIFHLCGKMRLIVLAALEFDEPHRKRLLDRIAAIEAETHKPKGMFDVVLAGVSDVGETLGKFGKDIKPLTERMTEVARIARKGTKEYDQIPAPEEIEKLPKPEDFEDQ